MFEFLFFSEIEIKDVNFGDLIGCLDVLVMFMGCWMVYLES